MIPAKYEPVVQLLIASALIGLLLALVFQLQETGMPADLPTFLIAWLGRFVQTYMIVLPLIVVVMPIARRLARRLVAPEA